MLKKIKPNFENYWLNMLDSVDDNLRCWRQTLDRQAADLPGRPGGVVARFKALGLTLTQQSGCAANREIYQEYQQLADHIMPTLARIHQRVEARREAVGITAKTQAEFAAADETLDVALRAALKRRI
ncbi:hypothetical protein ACQPT2_15300 [Erwinia amylovora]